MADEELRALFEAMRREDETTRRHFDVAFEAMKHEIRLIGESVSHLSEKLERTAANLEQKIDTSAAETRAMIKFFTR